MVNEVTKVELTAGTGFPRRFTVASATTIAKGTLLKLTSPRTAAANATLQAHIAGVASMEKDGTDNSISISAWTNFIGTFQASGAISVGEAVEAQIGAYNQVKRSDLGAASGAAIIGTALKTVADGADVDVRVQL